jgi:hypothetical protein
MHFRLKGSKGDQETSDITAAHLVLRHLLGFTSASWLNQVERFFALITQERIRRGAFTRVLDLECAIMDYLEHHNADPKPFVWTAPASAILRKVARARQALESQH